MLVLWFCTKRCLLHQAVEGIETYLHLFKMAALSQVSGTDAGGWHNARLKGITEVVTTLSRLHVALYFCTVEVEGRTATAGCAGAR